MVKIEKKTNRKLLNKNTNSVLTVGCAIVFFCMLILPKVFPGPTNATTQARSRKKNKSNGFLPTHILPDVITDNIICPLYEELNPSIHYKEMYEMSILEEELHKSEKLRETKEYTFQCGDDMITVPKPPEKTTLHWYQAAAVWCTMELESKRLGRPSNLLVWGFENDASYWRKSTNGRVVFLEDNKKKLHKIKKKHPGLEQYFIKHPTKISRDLKKFENKDGKAIQKLKEETDNLLEQLGDDLVTEEKWDVIIVNDPDGCMNNQHGRFGALFTSKRIVDSQGYGHIFLDDYQQKSERILSDVILEGVVQISESTLDNFGEKIGVWHRIHAETALYIEKFALFSFGQSSTAEFKSTIQNLAGVYYKK